MTDTSRRFLLKERTAEAHRRVDEKVGSFDSVPSYGRYLAGLFSFREPVEQALSKVCWPDELAGWRPTLVSADIRSDLDALSLPLPANRFSHPGFSSKSSLLGCLYVIEGSSLGARILLKRASALGIDGASGGSHLAAQASSNGWPRFVAALEAAAGFDPDIASRSAVETFASAEKAFAGLEYA